MKFNGKDTWDRFRKGYSETNKKVAVERLVNGKGDFFGPVAELKLNALKSALTEGKFSAPIFKASDLRNMAVSLYWSNSITLEQATTLLQRSQWTFEILAILPALNEKKELSESFNYFLDSFVNYSFFKILSDEDKQKLVALLKFLPKSELYYYKLSAENFIKEHKGVYYKQSIEEKSKLLRLNFSAQMIDGQGIFYVDDQTGKPCLIFLSAGMDNALNIVRFGAVNAIHLLPTCGVLSPSDIFDYLYFYRARPAPLKHSETQTGREAHNFKDVTFDILWCHDNAHRLDGSAIPLPIFRALLISVKLFEFEIKKDIKSGLSRESWYVIEGGYLFFSRKNKWTPERFKENAFKAGELGYLFFAFLSYEVQDFKIVNYVTPFFQEPNFPSVFGVIVILNLIKYDYIFSKLGIDIDFQFFKTIKNSEEKFYMDKLLDPADNFLQCYLFIKSHYHYIENDPTIIQIFKIYRIIFLNEALFQLEEKFSESEKTDFSLFVPTILSTNFNVKYLKDIHYKKISKDDFLSHSHVYQNGIYLTDQEHKSSFLDFDYFKNRSQEDARLIVEGNTIEQSITHCDGDETTLNIALYHGNLTIAINLIESGAKITNPNNLNIEGKPYIIAAVHQSEKILKHLCEYKDLNVNVQWQGMTALYQAAFLFNQAMVCILIKAGAKVPDPKLTQQIRMLFLLDNAMTYASQLEKDSKYGAKAKVHKIHQAVERAEKAMINGLANTVEDLLNFKDSDISLKDAINAPRVLLKSNASSNLVNNFYTFLPPSTRETSGTPDGVTDDVDLLIYG